VSKQRAQARAARETEAARQRAELLQKTERAKAVQARKDARAAAWRRMRLWQRTPSTRHKETRRTLVLIFLLLLFLTYVFTRSVQVVVGMAILLAIASPVLIKMSFDRSK
jgi:hypothetical protein